MLKKGDIILVLVLVALVAASLFIVNSFKNGNAANGKIAVIKQNDRIIKSIDLDKVQKPERIDVIGDYSNNVLVENGRIRFEDADCPDLVCVKTGWLTDRGDIAVCLPNQTIIKIEGESSIVDGVTF